MNCDITSAEKILRWFHSQIWGTNRLCHLYPGTSPRPGRNFVNPNKKRNLTDSEIESIFEIVQLHRFPVTIISSFNGTSFSLRIFSNYGESRQRLLTIESSQFPGNPDRASDRAVYEKMEELVGQKENIELIDSLKIARPARWSACCF